MLFSTLLWAEFSTLIPKVLLLSVLPCIVIGPAELSNIIPSPNPFTTQFLTVMSEDARMYIPLPLWPAPVSVIECPAQSNVKLPPIT